ncbi:hypothetical protein BKA70DRAFT_1571538 [Coprinopsis sp. MPI-PUGE-AT-0042]|nr:hypothetical protein BKA70DRAFT_1571538 [Coprinopsis sp. MPI-PUGE-AT-0042]
MGMTNALEEVGVTEADVQLRIVHLVGVWLEGLLYGVYLCLFIAAFPVLVRRSSLKNFSVTLFVNGNILMFVLISIHSATSICLPIFAFAYRTDSEGISHMLRDQHHWAYFISIVLGAMVFLTGDVLVINRCFLIWQRRYLVILVPCLLVALGTCVIVATMIFVHSVPISFINSRNWPIISLPFICYLLQNALTTALIAYKIYSHLRQARDVGLVSIQAPKLLPIVKIFVESAVIYTALVLVMAVLIALDHPAWFAMHSCLMPIIGIVFVLMALRIHAVQEDSKDMPASPSLLPSWLVNDKPVEKEEDQSPNRMQTRPLRHPGGGPQLMSQLCLFIAVLSILLRNGALKNFTAAVFFIGNMLIFVLVSIICGQSPHQLVIIIHATLPSVFPAAPKSYFARYSSKTPLGVSIFDTVVAFAYQIESKGPIRPFNDTGYWVGYIPLMLAVFIAIIGDILMVVIYRCFLVWQRSYRVIFVSLILAALAFGCHIATVWFANHGPFNLFRVQNWISMALTPIFYLLQTTLTTSLIAGKIWSQSRRNTNVAAPIAMTPQGLTEADTRMMQLKALFLVSVWLEGFLYGVYLSLFIAALPILIPSKTLKSPSASVFFIGNVLIFTLVSIHSGLSLFHVVVSFAYQTSVEGTMQAYNENYYRPILFAAFIFMIGDVLMTIFPSVVLAATSSGLHITVVWFATQVPRHLFLVRSWPPIALAIIFYFIQTSLTTFLIVWKIRSQFRLRTDIGLVSVHVPRILSIMRIIIESALIYTTGMLTFLVFLLANNPGRLVIHSCMLPITGGCPRLTSSLGYTLIEVLWNPGIVFVLMALRTHAVRQESRYMPASPSLLPTWLVEEPKSKSSGPQPVAEGD